MDPYSVLGISRGATPEQVNARFRQLAKETHPDLNPNDPESASKFSKIREAYRIIQEGRADTFEWTDMSGGRAAGKPIRRDIRKEIRITLAQAFSGGTIKVTGGSGRCDSCSGRGFHHTQPTMCQSCGGTGIADQQQRGIIRMKLACPDCGGRGVGTRTRCKECGGHGTSRHVPAEVTVPAGCQDGTLLTVPGGANDPEGGLLGDLKVVIRIIPDARFRLIGTDVETDVEIEVWDAALGGSVTVSDVLGRRYRLKIPPGTQPGRKFRMRHHGMPNSDGPGDLIAVIKVKIPDGSGGRVKDAYEALKSRLGNADR